VSGLCHLQDDILKSEFRSNLRRFLANNNWKGIATMKWKDVMKEKPEIVAARKFLKEADVLVLLFRQAPEKESTSETEKE
jgi:hypothetical protein